VPTWPLAGRRKRVRIAENAMVFCRNVEMFMRFSVNLKTETRAS